MNIHEPESLRVVIRTFDAALCALLGDYRKDQKDTGLQVIAQTYTDSEAGNVARLLQSRAGAAGWFKNAPGQHRQGTGVAVQPVPSGGGLLASVVAWFFPANGHAEDAVDRWTLDGPTPFVRGVVDALAAAGPWLAVVPPPAPAPAPAASSRPAAKRRKSSSRLTTRKRRKTK